MTQEFQMELTFEQRLNQIDADNKEIAELITAKARELVQELIKRKQPQVMAFLQANAPVTTRRRRAKEDEEDVEDTKSPRYRFMAAIANEVAERDGIALHEEFPTLNTRDMIQRIRDCVRNVPEPVLEMLGIADPEALSAEAGQDRPPEVRTGAEEGEIRPQMIADSLRMQLWRQLGMVSENHLEEILQHAEFVEMSSAVPEHMEEIHAILRQIQLREADVRALRRGLEPGATPDAVQAMLITRQRLCNSGFVAEPIETYLDEMKHGLDGVENPNGERVLVVGLMDKRKKKKKSDEDTSRLYALGVMGLYPEVRNHEFILARQNLLFGKSDSPYGQSSFVHPRHEERCRDDRVLGSTLRIGLIAANRQKPAFTEFSPHFLFHHMLELARSLRPDTVDSAWITSEITNEVMMRCSDREPEDTGLINRAGKRVTDTWDFKDIGHIWDGTVPSAVHEIDGERVALYGHHTIRGGKLREIHAQACLVRRNILVAFGKARREEPQSQA